MRAQQYFKSRYDYNSEIELLGNILVTDSGYFVVPTYLNQSFGVHAIIPAFIDLQGNISWLNEISNDTIDFTVGNVIPLNNYFYSVGSKSYSNGDRDMYLFKYNSNFDTIWTKIYGNDSIRESGVRIEMNSDSSFAIMCQEYNITNNVSSGDFALYNIDTSGNLIWKKREVLSSNEGPFDLEILKDSTYLLTGYSYSFGFGLQSYLMRMDSAGNKIWQNAYGTNITFGDCPAYAAATSDGGFIACGCLAKVDGIGLNPRRMYIRKYSANNVLEWDKEYGNSSELSMLMTIKELPDGQGYIAGGNHIDTLLNNIGVVESTLGLLKIDLNGDSIWMRTYRVFEAINGENYLEEVELTPDGGFVMCGYTSPPNFPDTGTQDIWVIKVDSMGCEQWGCHIIDGIAETIYPEQTINVYPNPTKDILHVNFTAVLNENVDAYLYNILGKKVLSTTFSSSNNTMNLESLPIGSYFLKVQLASGMQLVEKVVVAK